MPFDYYDSLSARNKAIYRQSDAITEVELEDVTMYAEDMEGIKGALENDKPRLLRSHVTSLCDSLAKALGIEPVIARVLSSRPGEHGGELHGLYEREEGQRAKVTVWMRTHTHKRPVAFRTFLRTLLHEICHHLDYEILQLADSFHTEGFFKRESSLMRAIAPTVEKGPKKPREKPVPKKTGKPEQLSLKIFAEK